MMNPAATLADFRRLSEGMHAKHVQLLQILDKLRLTCRCEMSGKDMVVVVAPALPPAAYWLNRFDIDNMPVPAHLAI